MTSNGNGTTPPTNLKEAWICSLVIMFGQLLFVVLTGDPSLPSSIPSALTFARPYSISIVHVSVACCVIQREQIWIQMSSDDVYQGVYCARAEDMPMLIHYVRTWCRHLRVYTVRSGMKAQGVL